MRYFKLLILAVLLSIGVIKNNDAKAQNLNSNDGDSKLTNCKTECRY